MQAALRGLLIVGLLLVLIVGPSQIALGQQSIPFDGLRLIYFAETTQTVQERTGVYASSWINLFFHEVSESSSKLDINVDGLVIRNGQQQAEKRNMTVDFPTDRDTLVFLRHGGQDNLTFYAGPSALTIPSLPGLTIDLTRSWNLHDKPLIRTPVGSFSGYRYHTSIKSISMPTGGTLDLDFYASYEENSQILMSGEVWATLNGASAMIVRTELRDTNLLSAHGQSRCLIATATYGSELAPQVQFLREFRDQKIQKTFAGSSFMIAFNLWYYSFSPSVARAVYTSPPLRSAMQLLLYPLITVLQVSAAIFGAFSFEPELAALLTGLAASAMIGIAYLWLPSMLISRRYRFGVRRLLKPTSVMLNIGIIGLLFAEVSTNLLLAALTSAMIVLSNLLLFAALPCIFPNRGSLVRWVSRKFSRSLNL